MQYKPAINTSGGEAPASSEGTISVENVQFRYPSKSDVPILKGVSINIERNKVVALVGPSGCGKSSIISLIERFYDPHSGAIKFDGRNVKDLNPRWYH